MIGASPATFYLHVHGHGDPIALATAIRAALAESKTPLGAGAPAPAQTAELDLDTGALDQAIGVKGKVNGGVYQFSVPRKDEITENGVPVPPAMGTAMVINFQPTGGGKAVITGDFVVSAPRGESPPPRPPRIRHRGDGGPQPHAGRDAAALLRAFLGQRRRDETR